MQRAERAPHQLQHRVTNRVEHAPHDAIAARVQCQLDQTRLAVRVEQTRAVGRDLAIIELDGPNPQAFVAKAADVTVNDVVLAVVRDRPLTPVARIETTRHVQRLRGVDGAVLAEFCDDHVAASAGCDNGSTQKAATATTQPRRNASDASGTSSSKSHGPSSRH